MKRDRDADRTFGPEYPVDLGSKVARFRSLARKGLQTLTPEQRRDYGNAVNEAILAKLRSEIRRELPAERRCQCASGTLHNTGEAIHAAVLQQQRTALASYPSQARRARSPDEWKELYKEAMKEKCAEAKRQERLRKLGSEHHAIRKIGASA